MPSKILRLLLFIVLLFMFSQNVESASTDNGSVTTETLNTKTDAMSTTITMQTDEPETINGDKSATEAKEDESFADLFDKYFPEIAIGGGVLVALVLLLVVFLVCRSRKKGTTVDATSKMEKGQPIKATHMAKSKETAKTTTKQPSKKNTKSKQNSKTKSGQPTKTKEEQPTASPDDSNPLAVAEGVEVPHSMMTSDSPHAVAHGVEVPHSLMSAGGVGESVTEEIGDVDYHE